MLGNLRHSLILKIIILLLLAIPLTETEVTEVKSVEEPKEVQIEVLIDWTPERIEEEVRKTFPEAPERALTVFMCESGKDTDRDGKKELQPEAVSPTHDYGIAQINRATWHTTALEIGLTEYQTDVQQNLQMARYVYEDAGNSFSPWVCDRKV